MAQSLMTLEELAAVKQQRNMLAVRQGLPAIGSRMVNQFGIEWLVDGHIYAPGLNSLTRDNGHLIPQHTQDLVPLVTPLNASQRLQDFWIEVDRCTCKEMLMVDTMPHLRPTQAHADGHWVDAWSTPDAILFFLDASHIDEAIFAHEIGHVWLDRVEGCEDYRVFRDLSDTQRVRLLQYVQSFVLDRKVNKLLRERGFDLSVIEQHQRESILSMAQALLLGYRPPLAREAAFSTLVIATTLLEQNEFPESESNSLSKGLSSSLLCCSGTIANALQTIRDTLPALYAVAENLVAIMQRHDCADRQSVLTAIDECIGEVFNFSGEPIDAENELVEEPPTEIKRDKWPEMLPDWSIEAKLEVGRAMAKQGIGAQVNMQLSYTPFGMAQVVFQKSNGEKTAPTVLQHAPTMPPQVLANLVAPMPEVRSSLQPCQPGVPPQFQHLITQAAQTKKPLLTTPPAANIPASPMPIDPAQMMRGWPQRNQGRDYLAGVGRWLSRARLAEQLGGEGPYLYVENNPVTWIDPAGLRLVDPVTGGDIVRPRPTPRPARPQAIILVGNPALAQSWNRFGPSYNAIEEEIRIMTNYFVAKGYAVVVDRDATFQDMADELSNDDWQAVGFIGHGRQGTGFPESTTERAGECVAMGDTAIARYLNNRVCPLRELRLMCCGGGMVVAPGVSPTTVLTGPTGAYSPIKHQFEGGTMVSRPLCQRNGPINRPAFRPPVYGPPVFRPNAR